MHASVTAAAALTAAIVCAPPIGGQRTAPLPLRVEQPRVVNGRATVEIVNVGRRPIVAWGVTAHVTYADGTSRGQEVMTDGFEQSVRNYPNSSVLPPGGRYVLVLPGAASLTEALTVTAAPTLVVFDDDTAAGDEMRIERIFAHRAVNQQVWQQLDTLLESAIERSAGPVSALRDAASQLSAIESVDVRRSAAFDEFDRKIASALRSGQADGVSAAARLQQLRQETALLRSVAVAHARRRF
jgi:hypothetical protein